MSLTAEEQAHPEGEERAPLYLVEPPEEDLPILAVSEGDVPGIPIDWLSSEIISGYRQEIRTMAKYVKGASVLDHAGVRYELPIDQIRSIAPARLPNQVQIRFKREFEGRIGKDEIGKPKKSVTTTIASLGLYVDGVRPVGSK